MDALHDHPFTGYYTDEYDPYASLNHRKSHQHGHDEYLGVEKAHDHDTSLKQRLEEAHRVRQEHMEVSHHSSPDYHSDPLAHEIHHYYPDY